MKNVVIVGAVAGGMSAATRLRRLDASANITVLEAGEHVSFANCGLPYYAGGVITERDALLLQTPESLHRRFDLDVRVRSRATVIDRAAKTVTVDSPDSTYTLPYDALILSPGASPIVPNIPGAERALTLRDVTDVDRIVEQAADARTAAVIGAGFVGVEIAENLTRRGIEVTLVELLPQVLPALDPEMAVRMQRRLERHGITVMTGASATEITSTGIVTSGSPHEIPADLVIASIGVAPASSLAADAGLDLGPRGAILVDNDQRTSDPAIFAVGDAAAKRDALSGEPTLIPLANLANRHGRRAADVIVGQPGRGRPSQGTAVVGAFGLTAAMTGRSEQALKRAGADYRVHHAHPMNHAGYYPGAAQLSLKLLVEPGTDRILGAQAVGEDGADKRIDVIATAMAGGLTAPELADLELAYAPAYGSAKDAVNMLGYIAENASAGVAPVMPWSEVTDTVTLLDVRTPDEVAQGVATVEAVAAPVTIPVDDLRARHHELPAGRIAVYCRVGQRAHTAVRLLRELGHEAVNLDGGYLTWRDLIDAGELSAR